MDLLNRKYRLTDERREALGEELLYWDYASFSIRPDSPAWECVGYIDDPSNDQLTLMLLSPDQETILRVDRHHLIEEYCYGANLELFGNLSPVIDPIKIDLAPLPKEPQECRCDINRLWAGFGHDPRCPEKN